MKTLLRALGALILAVGATVASAAPASAVAWGGYQARVSLDGWYDNNIARGETISPTSLPYGPQEVGLNLGLAVGNVFVITPELDTWVIVDAHGRTGYFYPTMAGAWGSLFSNTVYHLDGGRDLYALVGGTHFWSTGNYFAGEIGLIQPLWTGASARVEGGGGIYRSFTPGYSFNMPSVGFGLDQAFSTGTLVGFRYAFQTEFYEYDRVDPRHQFYLLASQRVWNNWEVHSRLLQTIDTSATHGYTETYVDAGIAYDF